MTEEPKEPKSASQAGQDQDAWSEMGQQLKSLGESFAQAVRTSWEKEENQRRVEEFRKGLSNMVNEVDQAIRETAESPKGKQFREEAEKTVASVRTAGEQAYQDARPHVISAMQQLNEELQKLIRRMEKQPPTEKGGPDSKEM